MKPRPGWQARLFVVVLAACGVASTAALAQNFVSMLPGPQMPELPPTGAWGEVIFSNAKWLVVQNHARQQFPIAIDNGHIHQFLVRWPSSLNLLTNESVVEAVGRDNGSNAMLTDHVDVFEGTDQLLVTPQLPRRPSRHPAPDRDRPDLQPDDESL